MRVDECRAAVTGIFEVHGSPISSSEEDAAAAVVVVIFIQHRRE